MTTSGCGWDEGEQSYCLLDANRVIVGVTRCLAVQEDRQRIRIEGVEHYSRYEVDGGVVEGVIPGSEIDSPVEAELEVDVPGRRLDVLRIGPRGMEPAE